HGFQHRRVRREEEINWIVKEAQITDVVTLLAGNQNHAAYEAAGLRTHTVPIPGDPSKGDAASLFATIDSILAQPGARVLVHREIVDDVVGGLMGGYLIASGLVEDPILAAALIQEILGRALGPEGRALIKG
ncbi:MAG: hypothetical protein R3246_10380, partial [Acidimicrobiia bacterium]|nr:hypothetical protein [Acidimicrobiia bacterium]